VTVPITPTTSTIPTTPTTSTIPTTSTTLTNPSDALHARDGGRSRISGAVRRRPITAFLVLLLGPTLAVYAAVIATGAPFFVAQGAELVFLLLAPLLVSRAVGGGAVRRLYAGLARWRFGVARWLTVLVGMPVVAAVLAAGTGTLHAPSGTWTAAVLSYLLLLVGGAATANLWEETAWTGFLQTRLTQRHGLFAAAMLTAVPFTVIHLPLAFQNGLGSTSLNDVLVTWAVLVGLAPFLRYLVGVVMTRTGGSTLAVGLLHAAFNATMAATVFRGQWQALAALVVLTVAAAVVHRRQRQASHR
jgi:membrane protease YdiL (CAAX protease family)